MSPNIAIQMDQLETIDIDADSTFAIAMEAQKRGHNLFHYRPDQLHYNSGQLYVTGHIFELRKERGNHFTAQAIETRKLSEFDLILMRQDPPFDMSYITATHLLDLAAQDVLVLNNPSEVRSAPEKIWCLDYPDLMPPTLITRDKSEIEAFRKTHGTIILKPLYGNGGASIFKVTKDNENLSALHEMFIEKSREPIMVQKHLPEIAQGDKRIILIDGEVAGAVNRVPQKGEARANFHVGGQAEKTELTPREIEICERLKPELKQRNLVFTGIDVIGDYLTEINVTSPTGIQEINHLNGACLEADLWDVYEDKIQKFNSQA